MRVYGGAEFAIVKLINYLVNEGHSVSLLTTYINDEIEKDLHGVSVVSSKDPNFDDYEN